MGAHFLKRNVYIVYVHIYETSYLDFLRFAHFSIQNNNTN